MNVETLQTHAAYMELVTVVKLVQQDALTEKIAIVAVEGFLADLPQQTQTLLMTIHVESAVVAVVEHHLHHHAYHPHTSQQVVGMGMGDEHVMNGAKWNAGFLQLRQDAVAPAAIDQQAAGVVASGLLHHKTGVIASCHGGVPHAQHGDFHRGIYVC